MPASAGAERYLEILEDIVSRLPEFNERMGIEPIPISGRAEHRFSRFEPVDGFMEHWGSALRVRWSIKLFTHRDGRVFVIYQYVMGFPDSPSTERLDTAVRIWFFERLENGEYRSLLQEELIDETPLMFRFGERASVDIMNDRLQVIPHVWDGTKLVRR